jgi:glutamine amidotransferase-like uncharacterized protein
MDKHNEIIALDWGYEDWITALENTERWRLFSFKYSQMAVCEKHKIWVDYTADIIFHKRYSEGSVKLTLITPEYMKERSKLIQNNTLIDTRNLKIKRAAEMLYLKLMFKDCEITNFNQIFGIKSDDSDS